MIGRCRHCGAFLQTSKKGYLLCKNTKNHPGGLVYVPGKPGKNRLS